MLGKWRNSIELRKTQATIDLDSLMHNLRSLKSLLGPDDFVCPMVKANAYGHGDIQVALACEKVGVSALGVALYSEAESLRAQGCEASLLVFEPGAEIPVESLEANQFLPVVSSKADLEKLRGVSCEIHLKFNTGMNRLGFQIEQISDIKEFLSANPMVRLGGVCSHLSHGFDVGVSGGQSEKQIQRFLEVEKQFSGICSCFHLWNSSGLLAARGRELPMRGWGARPGISLYGGYTEHSIRDSQVQQLAASLSLKPVMTLQTQVKQAYWIKKGEIVSYGGTWKAPRNTIIAVLSLGYADGFFRYFSNRMSMSLSGGRASVVGRICMDYTMLDVTDLVNDPEKIIGEQVVVYGSHERGEPLAETSAEEINTIAYELFTSVSPRVPRVFEGEV